jgi:hypothetical protein
LQQVNPCPFVEIADTRGSEVERYDYVGNINSAIIESHVNESVRATGTIDRKVAGDLGGYTMKGYNNLSKEAGLSYYQYSQEKDLYNKNISNYEFFAQRLAQEDYMNDKDGPESFNIEEYYGNESLVYFDVLDSAPLRLLTSQNGYVIWDKDSHKATVSCNDITYAFRVNSDRTISLIKDGFDYGKFKRADAELVRYELKGKYLDNIFIKKDLFNKYFEISDTHEETVNQNIAKTEDIEMSQLAREYIERLDYLYGNLDGNYVPKAQADLLRSLDKISKDKGLGGGITNTYSIKDAMRIILDEQITEVWRQSLLQNVPKEMIASVLFREIMCYDVFDKYQDGSMEKQSYFSNQPRRYKN